MSSTTTAEKDVSRTGPSARGQGKILEIGHFCLFKRVHPERTRFIDLSLSPEDHGGLERERPGALAQRRLAARIDWNAYELVVLHASERSPREVGFWFDFLRRPIGLSRSAWARHALQSQGSKAIAILDYGDRRFIARHNHSLVDLSRTYFKRELAPDVSKAFVAGLPNPGELDEERRAIWEHRLQRLAPISLGLSAERLAVLPAPDRPKEIDVFFAGDAHGWPNLRRDGLGQLRRLQELGYRVELSDRGLSLSEYLDRCAAAWLVWSPEGLGWDCFRHYEAAACGSVPLMSAPTIRRYAPLLNDVHCLVYDVEEDGLSQCIVTALQDKGRLQRIGAAARAHVLKHHTHPALCAYIARTCLDPDRGPQEPMGVALADQSSARVLAEHRS